MIPVVRFVMSLRIFATLTKLRLKLNACYDIILKKFFKPIREIGKTTYRGTMPDGFVRFVVTSCDRQDVFF